MRYRSILVSALFLAITIALQAQNTQPECSLQPIDSLKVEESIRTEEGNNRNIMLNAESATKPREISIGLPSSIGGTEIYEDGVLVGYYFWPVQAEAHWRGGESYASTSTMSVGKNAIKSGNVGYAVDSYTKLGSDRFHGSAAINANHYGMVRADVNVNGPLGKGFYYTGGVYFNFDPGSTKIPFAKFIDKTRIIKAGLTKRWNDGKGEISLHYKNFDSRIPGLAGTAPFYYEGDGSISSFEGFRLGLDNYTIRDGAFTYMKVKDGEMTSDNLRDVTHRRGHDILLRAKYDFDNGLRLAATTKAGHGRTSNMMYSSSGIDNLDKTAGYTTLDGTPFSGNVQNRFALYFDNGTDHSLTTVELSKKSGHHEWLVGLNEWIEHQFIYGSTFSSAHTVQVDPEPLLKNGSRSWNHNASAEYAIGWENKTALYATHQWEPSSRFNLFYGLRLEMYSIDVDGAFAGYGIPGNERHDGFNLKEEAVSIQNFKHTWLNPTGTINAKYLITKSFGIAGDYMFVRERPRIEHFNQGYPSTLDPVDVQLARFGITFDRPWISLTSMVSYIYKTNNKSQTRFYKMIDGEMEVQTRLMIHGIATTGWTTDINLKPFKHFSLHLLTTLQDPKYTDYATTLTFSDGITETYDYSGKTVKGVPNFLLEIDPSYSRDKWRVWLSARYFSKHYANMPNTVFFNGHWETFGGFDYTFNEHVSASFNVVNILNQTGANGSIAAADLMNDTSILKHYLMSGSYIRPFTMELSIRVSF